MSVRSLQHIALAVPDPSLGRKFYEDFGLEARESGASIAMRCAGRNQDQVVLVEGKKRHQHHISFGTGTAELKAVKKRLEQEGVKLLDAPKETPLDGLWFHDPDGLLVNVRG